jgi:hypothetical protein
MIRYNILHFYTNFNLRYLNMINLNAKSLVWTCWLMSFWVPYYFFFNKDIVIHRSRHLELELIIDIAKNVQFKVSNR